MKSDDAAKKALDFLPHGPEFRFVDKLLSLVPGKEGTGEYRVRGDEPFLRGHFPRDPIFPGVLLIERPRNSQAWWRKAIRLLRRWPA